MSAIKQILVGKPVALIQVPNQRGFKTKAAARYLGISDDTLRASLVSEAFLPERLCFSLSNRDRAQLCRRSGQFRLNERHTASIAAFATLGRPFALSERSPERGS